METLQKKKKPFIHVDILAELAKERQERLDVIKKNGVLVNESVARMLGREVSSHDLSKLEERVKEGSVFTASEIKAIAQKYALRFAKASDFKADIPAEAIEKLCSVVESDKIITSRYYGDEQVMILAPTKAFTVTYHMDPVMFIRTGDSNWKVVAKWGKDFTVFRRLKSRDFKWLHTLIGVLTCMFGFSLAIINWFWGQAWYYSLIETVVFGVIGFFGVILWNASTSNNPEPFFYDETQWDRVNIRIG